MLLCSARVRFGVRSACGHFRASSQINAWVLRGSGCAWGGGLGLVGSFVGDAYSSRPLKPRSCGSLSRLLALNVYLVCHGGSKPKGDYAQKRKTAQPQGVRAVSCCSKLALAWASAFVLSSSSHRHRGQIASSVRADPAPVLVYHT